MQLIVLGIVVGAIVAALAGRELNAIDELDVGAVVEFVGMAGGRVADEKSDRATVLNWQRSPGETVNDQPLAADFRQRHAGVKIVGGGVQGEVTGPGPGPG